MVQKLDKYFEEIKKGLKSSRGKNQHVIDELKSSVSNYLAENPNATIEDIYEHFGSPQTVIETNVTRITGKRILMPKRLVKIIAIILAVFIAAAGIFWIVGTIQGSSSNRGHFSDNGGVEESVIWDDNWTTTAPDTTN